MATNSVLVKQLTEARAKAHHSAIEFLKAGLTSENRGKYDAAMNDVERLAKEIRLAESDRSNPDALLSTEHREQRNAHSAAFFDFLRRGDRMREESRSILEKRTDQAAGTQTISYTSGAAGGYLVPAEFQFELEQAQKAYAPFLDGNICRVITTESGAILPFPTGDDTANAATIVAENGSISEQSVTFGSVPFQAYKLSTGIIKVSVELLNDSAFDFDSYLAQRFGERFGRGLQALATTGSGSAQPTGILTALANASAPVVIANGSAANDGSTNTGANSIGSQDLVNLEHSVDPAYRNSRSCAYMLNDKTLGFLKGLLDKYGRPLWAPGISSGDPGLLNGYRYIVNQAMPDISASQTPVIFGDLTKYVIRRVKGVTAQRLTELYAANGQVGFQAFQRVDGNYVNSGGKALGVLQNHS